MQLFYQPTIDKQDSEFTFDKIESRHIVRVLRKKEGDLLHITNGKKLLVTAKILDAHDKKCRVQLLDFTLQDNQKPFKLCVAIAPTKSNERFEWFLEKATEIGIDEIYPIRCKHSERKVIKPERLQKVLITAMKQSLHFQLPVLHNLQDFKDFIHLHKSYDKFIAYCENEQVTSSRNALQTRLKPQKDVCILIGPEGDFSQEEIALALENGFIPVSLGTARLRTETAGIVAVHTVHLLNDSI